MSEHLRAHGEKKTENLELSVESKHNLEQIQKRAKQESEPGHEVVEKLSHTAKKEAVSGKEVTVGEHAEQSSQQPAIGSHQTLKKQAYKQSLSNIRKHLPAGERSFSKVIHQPAVQAVSEVSAKTIARPSGLLVGGICALLGSTFVLFAARRYGFRYNFGLFIVLLVGGYLVGLLAELLYRLVRRSPQ